jgi:hypothetical protein
MDNWLPHLSHGGWPNPKDRLGVVSPLGSQGVVWPPLGVAEPPHMAIRGGFGHPHGLDGVTGHRYYFIKIFNF